MTKFLDRDHPMFRHMWVKLLTAGVPGGMAVLEFTMGSPGWGMLFGAAAVWAVWELFLRK